MPVSPPSPVLLSAERHLDALLSRAGPKSGRENGLLVLGICGAQGSGKSTLASALAARLAARAIPCAILSLDDLYRTRAERQAMARQVHPLFATRGVPGTHDVDLGLATIAALRRGESVALPRFDKARDDRAPSGQWPVMRARVLIFEGWCLGLEPQSEEALTEPVNALERNEDPHGIWRKAVNTALAGPYRALWATLDSLIFLAAPDFETVRIWRREQEEQLRARMAGDASPRGAESAAGPMPGLMDQTALARFMAHYERLTRHALATLPARADLTLPLDRQRNLTR